MGLRVLHMPPEVAHQFETLLRQNHCDVEPVALKPTRRTKHDLEFVVRYRNVSRRVSLRYFRERKSIGNPASFGMLILDADFNPSDEEQFLEDLIHFILERSGAYWSQ